MAFVLETGAGVPGANAYVVPSFVTTYLTERGREEENDWAFKTTAEQQEAIVQGTDYIEKRWSQHFAGVKSNYLIAGRKASGTLTLGGLPTDTETLTVGIKTYRLVAALTQENDILIGSTATETAENIVEAIGVESSGSGVSFDESTLINYEVSASSSSAVVTFTARVKGENGNEIALATTITGATVSGSSLAGGLDEGEQALSFPRARLYTPDGALVVGVPLKLRQATAEYASRALAAALAPDPSVAESLVPVLNKREVVGPIEEETEYAAGGQPVLLKPYPAADRLLMDFIVGGVGGRVYRG